MEADGRFAELERRTRKVSVAFFFVDDLTGDEARGIVVSVAGDAWRPVRNRSGYHVFTGMPEGRHEFLVEGPGYLGVKEALDLKQAGMPYLLSRRLAPLPSYEFPAGTTLIRGTVLEEGSGTPLENVRVGLSIFGKAVESATAADGAFVLYLTGLGEKRTATRNGRLLVADDDKSTEFSLSFSIPGHADATGTFLLEKEGAEEEVAKFAWEVGKVLRIKKYLRKGG